MDRDDIPSFDDLIPATDSLSFDDLIPEHVREAGAARDVAARTPTGAGRKTGLVPTEDIVGQNVAEAAKGIPAGAGGMAGMSLAGLGGLSLQHAAAATRAMYEIDAGGGPARDAIDTTTPLGQIIDLYRDATPAQRQRLRNEIAAMYPAARDLIEQGRAVREAADIFPAAKGYEESVGRQIGEGLGSLGAGVAASFAGGPIPAAAMFALAGAGEAAERAVRDGATEDQIIAAARAGLLPGLTDSVPVETLLGRLPLPGGRTVAVAAEQLGPAMRSIARIGWQAFVEGVQEGGQEFLQNLIAREVYKPGQDLFEDVLPGAGIGAAVGAIAEGGRQGTAALFPGRRSVRQAARESAPPLTPEDRASPIPDDIIAQGRSEVADGQATATANDILRRNGLPEIGSKVTVQRQGGPVEGVIEDAFVTENPTLGLMADGLRIKLADGTVIEESVATLRRSGAFARENSSRVRPHAPGITRENSSRVRPHAPGITPTPPAATTAPDPDSDEAFFGKPMPTAEEIAARRAAAPEPPPSPQPPAEDAVTRPLNPAIANDPFWAEAMQRDSLEGDAPATPTDTPADRFMAALIEHGEATAPDGTVVRVQAEPGNRGFHVERFRDGKSLGTTTTAPAKMMRGEFWSREDAAASATKRAFAPAKAGDGIQGSPTPAATPAQPAQEPAPQAALKAKIKAKRGVKTAKSDQQPESPANLPAAPLQQGLFVQIGDRRYEVESLEDASRKFVQVRDTMGKGNSETPKPLVVDGAGRVVGHLAYNGRIFPGRPEDWEPGVQPLYDNRNNDRPDTDEAGEDAASTAVRDSREIAAGRIPVADARESQRLENVRKMEELERAQARPEAQPATAPQARPEGWGASNKLVSADRAEEIRARLRAKIKNQLNSGIDPETLALGAELAAFHIEAGARKFIDFAQVIARDMNATLAEVRPYLRAWYNSARDLMEDAGLDVADMDGPDAVKAALATLDAAPAATEGQDGDQGRVPGSDAPAGPGDVQPPAPDGRAGRPRSGQGRGSRAAVRGPDGEGPETAQRGGTGTPQQGSRGAGQGDAAGLPGRGERPDAGVTGTNHIIAPGSLGEDRAWRQKARDNIRAIELMREIEADGRTATKAEQAELARYVGWGGIAGAFPNQDGAFAEGFEQIGARLQELLTDAEYRTARRSIQYAHYTSETIVRTMWDLAERLGFKGGRVFEPGMGVGNFAGMMPPDVAAATAYDGLELDHTTARIARLLYPRWGVRRDDFTRAPLPESTYDLVIGNPPFADVAVTSDPKYAQHRFLLHDYFFAKSLDAVRPGGLLMFISSAGTMNKVNTDARDYMAARADLVGAIRLPGNAFERNAGTSVTTDIIVLRRRLPGERPGSPAWTETVEVTLPDKEGGRKAGAVNRYFAENPDMVLGEQGFFDKLYAGRYAVRAPAGFDLAGALQRAVAAFPSNVVSERQGPEERAEIDFGTAERKEGSFYLDTTGNLMQVAAGVGRPVGKRGKGVEGGRSQAEIERIKALIPLRDALRAVYTADLNNDVANADRARERLNAAYDAFTAKFGPINKAEISYRRPNSVMQESARQEAREEARYAGQPFDEGDFDPTPFYARKASLAEIARARKAEREAAQAAGRTFREGDFDPAAMPDIVIDKRPNIEPFMDDPESYRLRAIEKYDDDTGTARKSAVFFENVVTRGKAPEINSVNDALFVVLNQTGRVDIPAIALAAGVTEDEAVYQLGNAIFPLPGAANTYELRDAYLSGNVRKKLAEAEAAAERDPRFRANVDALKVAQPTPLGPSQISANLGMPWLPTDVIATFADKALSLGVMDVTYHAGLAEWRVRMRGGYTAAATADWGTARRPADELLQDALNRQDPKVYDFWKDSDGEHHELNVVETQAAQDKLAAIKERFRDWIWSEPARAERLAALYNEQYNSLVVREYDGSYLTTPGVSAEWSWRPHQTRVIARIIQSGNTYMAHAVGAGKTSAMIGAGMEMRRLGLKKKPMYVVPNHMLGQFTKEFYEQYPTARIAVADERRFHTDKRKQFIADVALDDLDAVIITHSAFGMIPMSEQFMDGIVQEQIDQYREMLEDTGGGEDERITRKRLEKAIERLEQRLSGRMQARKDQVFTFEEMGVDFLFVDEAHLFRKLDFATKMGSVKGVSPDGSKKAFDLYAKVRYLRTVDPTRHLVLASGTPVTNTMAELYSLSRYMQEAELADRSLGHFDAWAGAFGDMVSDTEQDAAGGYKPVARFARFVNVPELSAMVRQVMDVVTSKQLAQYVTRPTLKGGRRAMNLAERSPALAEYQQGLAKRMKDIADRKGPPKKGDDIILNVINDGRHAAIDMRLVDPSMPPTDPPSKLDMLVENVHRLWLETREQPLHRPGPGGYSAEPVERGPASQMIFANLGVGDARGFSVHRYIVTELVRRGVPRDQVAEIADFTTHVAKQRLFNDVNEGKVRVLIGSTAKMATGVNAQRRLYAIHNLDPLWYPADDEQRNGRGIRQGNMNPEIEIHDYGTKATYDSTMWGMMARKARFIEGFFEGDPTLRDIEDLGEASLYEQAKALSTADPRMIQLTELKQELEKAERRLSAHRNEMYSVRYRIEDAKRTIARNEERLVWLDDTIARRQDTKGDLFRATLEGVEYDDRTAFGTALLALLEKMRADRKEVDGRAAGQLAGFDVVLDASEHEGRAADGKRIKYWAAFASLRYAEGQADWLDDVKTPLGATRSLEMAAQRLDARRADAQREIDSARQTIADFEPRLNKTFSGQDAIDELRQKVDALQEEIERPVGANRFFPDEGELGAVDIGGRSGLSQVRGPRMAVPRDANRRFRDLLTPEQTADIIAAANEALDEANSVIGFHVSQGVSTALEDDLEANGIGHTEGGPRDRLWTGATDVNPADWPPGVVDAIERHGAAGADGNKRLSLDELERLVPGAIDALFPNGYFAGPYTPDQFWVSVQGDTEAFTAWAASAPADELDRGASWDDQAIDIFIDLSLKDWERHERRLGSALMDEREHPPVTTLDDALGHPEHFVRAKAFQAALDAFGVGWYDGTGRGSRSAFYSQYVYVQPTEAWEDAYAMDRPNGAVRRIDWPRELKVRFADHWNQSSEHGPADFNIVHADGAIAALEEILGDPRYSPPAHNQQTTGIERFAVPRDQTAPFFSALTRAVEAMPQPKAPATQWALAIRNLTARGVKQDEIDWSGVADWLGGQGSASLTKDAVLAYLRANEVKVEEVVKSADAAGPVDIEAENIGVVDEGDGTWSVWRGEEYYDTYQTEADAIAARDALIESLDGNDNGPDAPRYSGYVLPGGANYRELLLRMNDPRADYRSNHWDEANILAHVRFNERTDADGKRVLFIEEIQSDWHQAGRKMGYRDKPDVVDVVPTDHPELRFAVRVNGVEQVRHTTSDRAEIVARHFRENLAFDRRNEVPDAPLKTTWHEMAFRRMVRWAAEQGFDRLAWTTGEQQAERYDLSKSISEVRLYGSGNEMHLSAWDSNRKSVFDLMPVTESSLADRVGKEVAERLLSKPAPTNSGAFRALTGLDLKVGGEGMKGFYDLILPAYARKFGKRFGAEVRRTSVPTVVPSGIVYERAPSLKPVPAHAIDITPAMREAALTTGFPMFAAGGPRERVSPAFREALAGRDRAKVVASLERMLARIGIKGDVALRVADRLEEWNRPGTVSRAEGRYWNKVIEVALAVERDPRATLGHEVIHALKELGLIRPLEYRLLERAVLADKALMADVRRRYGAAFRAEGLTGAALEEALIEEAIADMYGDWAAGRSEVRGFIRAAFERMRAFLEGLGAALRELAGMDPYAGMTAEQVMGRIERGASVTTARATAALQAQPEPVQRAFAAAARMALGPRGEIPAPPDRIPTREESRASGKAAMNVYLSSREPEAEPPQWHAMHRRGVGWISFVWADESGLGINHIIEERSNPAKQGLRGKALSDFMLSIPDIIADGQLQGWHEHRGTLGRTIFKPGSGRVVLNPTIAGEGGYERLTWIATAYPAGRAEPLNVRRVADVEAERIIKELLADAARPGYRSVTRATQTGPSNLRPEGASPTGSPLAGLSDQLGAADRQDTPGGGKGKPGPRKALPRGPVEFGDRRTEDRWQEARKGAASAETLLERTGAWLTYIAQGFARHYIALPNNTRYADVAQQLRKLEAAPQASKEKVVRFLRDLTRGMSGGDLDLFTRKVVLDDLAWEASQDRELPFGFTADSLAREKARVDAAVAARPDLVQAVRQRKLVVDSVAQQLVAAGVLHEEQVRNPAYYRHQVLDYARAQVNYAKTGGKKLRTPHWARREGSTLDINANLLEAEFDWLHKAYTDIEAARVIEWIKRSNHNIRADVIAAARDYNARRLDAVIARDMRENGFPTDATDPETGEIIMSSPLTEIAKGFRQQIARGIAAVRRALDDGAPGSLPASLRDAYDAIMEADAGNNEANIFPLLAWLMDNGERGAQGAAQVFKAISLRREWVKGLLGDDYADPMNVGDLVGRFAPDGYVAWQPDEGKLLFTAKTIPERVMDMMLARIAQEGGNGLSAEELRGAMGMLRTMLAVGGPKYQMVLPEELASTLNSLRDEHVDGLTDAALAAPMRAWKRWILINPFSVLKYNLNNLSGDLDAVIAGNPKALRKLGPAIGELWSVMVKGGAPSTRYREAVERGVFDSGLTVQEIPDINALAEFANLMERPAMWRLDRHALKNALKIWRALQKYTQFRENWMRYAAYLDYVERIEGGEGMASIGYGATRPDLVEAVSDPKDRAALLARELVGDYGAISHWGEGIRRKLIPFWSWMEINTKRYWRLFGNAWAQGAGRGLVTAGYLGAALGARTSLWLLLRMGLLYGLVNLWNHLLFPDDEDELKTQDALKMHVNLGRDADGVIRTLKFQGALSDFLGWIGFEDAVAAIMEVEKGRADVGSVLKAVAKAPVNRLANGLSPVIQTPVEALSGFSFWPDVFRPQPIRDQWRNFFSNFRLEFPYDVAAGRPTRGAGDFAERLILQKVDADENAYNRTRSLVYDWLRREKGQEGVSTFTTPRAEALRDWRLAKRFGDRDAADRAAQRLREMGVSPSDIEASIKRAHPLGPIAIKDRARFLNTLTPEERQRLSQAVRWYDETFRRP